MKLAGISIYKNKKSKEIKNDDTKSQLTSENLINFTIDGVTTYKTAITNKYHSREKYVPKAEGDIVTQIPGVVTKINTKEGAKVKVGESLCILDAMKMSNDICSNYEGKVETICVTAGDKVKKGDILFKITIKENKHAEDKVEENDNEAEILAF